MLWCQGEKKRGGYELGKVDGGGVGFVANAKTLIVVSTGDGWETIWHMM
jgi:hypothetical protein